MKQKPLYLDLSTSSWVDDPESIDTIRLVEVSDINFTTYSDISSDTADDYAMGSDEESRAAAAKYGDPRESSRKTYLIVHAAYNWNGEYGCVAKTAETLLSTMIIKDDGMGNIINYQFTPTADLITKNEILDLIKDGVIASINSNMLSQQERAYIETIYLARFRIQFHQRNHR